MIFPQQDTGHHFYHVLNLNRGASQSEVQERYRSLSLLFHPDRQQGNQAKDVATRNFLKIQKAYEVLSDPFLREVYDQLGDEGLAIDWSEGFRSKPFEEIREKLADLKGELRQTRQNGILSPQGTFHCLVDATSLSHRGHRNILDRVLNIHSANFSLRHEIRSRLSDHTTLGLGVQVRKGLNYPYINGTVRHQFSPRLSSLALVHFGFPFQMRLETSYQDGTNSLLVKVIGLLGAPLNIPALNISLARKLFRRRAEKATIDILLGNRPHVKLRLISPTPFGPQFSVDGRRDNTGEPLWTSGSLSGLESGIVFSAYGLDLEQGDPQLVGEFGVDLLELGTTLKTGLTLGLTGVSWFFSAMWSFPAKSLEISTMAKLGSAGIVFVIEMSRLEQRLSLPILLSTTYDGPLAMCTTVVPSLVGILMYRFVVLPRRRTQRLAYLRSARKRLEQSEERRERNAVETLIKDLARKHTQLEKAKQGLVILEGSYGSNEESESVKDLILDVTIPLQALVRNSQVFIAAGEEAKLNIQGFCDPVPSVPKVLRVRYLFREQMHYAEIPDFLPTVLPLLEHRVA